MSPGRWTRWRGMAGLVALALCATAPHLLAGQTIGSRDVKAKDAVSFKEFSARVQAYVTLQKAIDSKLPVMKPTDLPEMITAHQQALARKIREARPRAKAGDLFTPGSRDAFRRASRAALTGPNSVRSRAYMKSSGPNPAMLLAVNAVYPDTEPMAAPPPELLAELPPLPVEVAYRIVGRTLILIDVKSRLIVDVAREILPPAL